MKSKYDPYSRTYKIICLQNQIAHVRNKNTVKSLTKSNISINNSLDKSISKDQLTKESFLSYRPPFANQLLNQSRRMGEKKISLGLIEPYRQIHMNQSYVKKRKREEHIQNERLAKRLCNISCNVVTKEEGQQNFKHHLSHRKIARRYKQNYDGKWNNKEGLTISLFLKSR